MGILVCFYFIRIYSEGYYSHIQMKKCWAGKREKHIGMQAKDKQFEASLITQTQILPRYNPGKNPTFPSRCFPCFWPQRRLALQPHSSSPGAAPATPAAWGSPPATHLRTQRGTFREKQMQSVVVFHFPLSLLSLCCPRAIKYLFRIFWALLETL